MSQKPVTLGQVLATVNQIPSLPTVVTELMSGLQGSAMDLDTLAGKISLDPALTARLLQLANSSFYGLPRQVSHVAEAVALLGLRNVRSVVATAAVMGRLPLDGDGAISFQQYWRHAIGAALCAEKIAIRCGLDRDTAHVAGLLQDIGQLLLASRFAVTYRAVLAYQQLHQVPMVQAEQFEMGLNHALVGAALAEHWKLPAPICRAISEHHDAYCVGRDPIVVVVHLADAMSQALAIQQGEDDRLKAVPDAAWQSLDLVEDDLRSIFTQTAQELALMADVLLC